MKVVGFIGACDKTDMLLNIAKVIATMGKKVLLIDSTIMQKARYIVPAINPTMAYITSFENFDVAVGFRTVEEMQQYVEKTGEMTYDYALVDCDTVRRTREFKLDTADSRFFVTSFDVYSLKRGTEIIAAMDVPINLTKIYCTNERSKEDDEYLNYLSLGSKVVWDNKIIYFPIDQADTNALIENQRVQKIKFRRLSNLYKDALCIILQQILVQEDEMQIRNIMKKLEKGA